MEKLRFLFERGSDVLLNPISERHKDKLLHTKKKNLPCSVAFICLNPPSPVRCLLQREKNGILLWSKTWKMQGIQRLILKAGVLVGAADNAVHHQPILSI